MEDKKFKVIIVEDVKLELKGTEEIFRHEIPNAEVIGTAMTESEFWTLIEAGVPDLVLLFGHLLAIGFQISPELSIFFHTASLSAAQKLFHQIILWRTVKFGRAVLFHNIENLIPEQICLFLKCLAHLHKRGSNNAARGRVLSQQSIGTEGFFTLYKSGECLRVTFQQPFVDVLFTATLFQPEPRDRKSTRLNSSHAT